MEENKTFEAPTFTPPTPTFTPPKHEGPCCYYHKDEPAVSSCARCGKHLCDDCHDSYQVTIGEYAGKALCYDLMYNYLMRCIPRKGEKYGN